MRPMRLVCAAACVATAFLGAAGAGTATLSTGATTSTAPTTGTAPTSTAPAPAPVVTSLRVPRRVTAQQGHAQLLVGVRLNVPATITLRITAQATGAAVRTVTGAAPHPAGRAYLLVPATTDQGYQIPQGAYRLTATATDSQGRTSPPAAAPFQLTLTTPRGVLDAYTVPMWPAFAREARAATGGMLVAAVAPGGTLAKAGLRRGDVIVKVGDRTTATAGAYQAAARAVLAGAPLTVTYLRAGQTAAAQVTPLPDWSPVTNWTPVFSVLLRRDPRRLAWRYASARSLVETGKAGAALTALAAWPRGWRRSAVGWVLRGQILAAQNDDAHALTAYAEAIAKAPGLAQADFGRGLAAAALGQTAPAVDAFTLAAQDDPSDAVAQAFRAYALLRANRAAEALDAANRAIALDPTWPDGQIARGLALIAAGRVADGVRALKRGLVMLPDAARAQELITANLEPNDP